MIYYPVPLLFCFVSRLFGERQEMCCESRTWKIYISNFAIFFFLPLYCVFVWLCFDALLAYACLIDPLNLRNIFCQHCAVFVRRNFCRWNSLHHRRAYAYFFVFLFVYLFIREFHPPPFFLSFFLSDLN